MASIVRTPLPKPTDFSTLLARWHDVAQRLGREREAEAEKQTPRSGSRSGSLPPSRIRGLCPCYAQSELRLEQDSGGSGRQSQLKVPYNSWTDRIHSCSSSLYFSTLGGGDPGGGINCLFSDGCFVYFPAPAAQSVAD